MKGGGRGLRSLSPKGGGEKIVLIAECEEEGKLLWIC